MKSTEKENVYSKGISFFCPAYNEEANLEKIIALVLSVLKEITSDFEIIIVDNGSFDRTGEIADKLAKDNPKIRVIHHEKNREYGGALKSGFLNSTKEIVVYTDSDNQYDFSEFKLILPHLELYDVVTGYRIKRNDSSYRLFQSAVFNMLIRILFGLKLKDINCSFKAYKRSILDNMRIFSNSSFIDAEMLIKAKQMGCDIVEVPVHHFHRLAGKPTGAKPEVIFITLKEIFYFWFESIHKSIRNFISKFF